MQYRLIFFVVVPNGSIRFISIDFSFALLSVHSHKSVVVVNETRNEYMIMQMITQRIVYKIISLSRDKNILKGKKRRKKKHTEINGDFLLLRLMTAECLYMCTCVRRHFVSIFVLILPHHFHSYAVPSLLTSGIFFFPSSFDFINIVIGHSVQK